MADRDDASATHLGPTYMVQQIGGGRRQSPTPVLETPTRLHPRQRPTYADSDDVCKTLGIRSKPRADAPSQPNGSGEAAQISVAAPTCPTTTSCALPSIPSSASDQPIHSSTSRQPLLAPADESVVLAVHPILIPPNGLSHPLFASLPPTTSIVPVGPPSRPHSTAPTSSLAASSSALSAGVTLPQASRIHPAPPAGPRKPSGSHSLPPPDHELPFIHPVTSSNEELSTPVTEDVITVRPLIPRTCVIPPTPQHVGPLASTSRSSEDSAHAGEFAVQQAGVEEVNPDRDVEMDGPIASMPSTPSSRRRSAETQAILDAGYVELDAILDRVSSQVSLTPQQVLDSWHKSRGRVINGVNHWNVYQGFFKAHEEQERRRIGLSPEEPGTPSTMSRCYKKFIADHADTWKDILKVYELTEVIKSSQMTISQRSQTFNRFCCKIGELLDTAAQRHGFEAAIVMCGNIVNKDASLGHSHTTSGASNFWGDRCRACPDTIIGYLKAHVYNAVSLQSVERAFGDDAEVPTANVEAPGVNEEQSAPDVVRKPPQDGVAAPQTVADDSDVSLENNVDPTPHIKTGIIQLVRGCGVDTTKLRGANFPWKTLLAFMVEKGLVMEGYPYDVLMPGEKQSGTTRMKGLNSLTLPQKRVLASALCAKRVVNSRELSALVNNQSPVIVEEVPPPGSHQSHGRRMFGDGSFDRHGPPQVHDGKVCIRKRSSNKRKVRYIKIMDDSSPVTIRDVKPPHTSKSKGEPIKIPSDTENMSVSEATESHDGGDVPKKRKASTAKHAPKKRMKHTESLREAKEWQDRKGKAVALDIIESSDEELLSGKILTACPKPRVVRRLGEHKEVEGNDVFCTAGPSYTSEVAFSESLKKEITGPDHVSHSVAPPSPSPPPRVLECRHALDTSKTAPMANKPRLPSVPAELPADTPSGQPGGTVMSSQTIGPSHEGVKPATPCPDQQRSGHPAVDPTQPSIGGNGYFIPNGNYAHTSNYGQPFLGMQASFRGTGFHDGQNTATLDMLNVPGVYQGGNMNMPGVYVNAPGVYQGGGNMNMHGVYQGGNVGSNVNAPGIYQGGTLNVPGVYQVGHMNIPGVYGGNANSPGVYQGGNTNAPGPVVYQSGDTTGQSFLNIPDLGRGSTLPNLPAPPNPQGKPSSQG